MSEAFALLHYPSGLDADTLLVMLPGAGIEVGDFAAQGMVAAVRARGLAVDIIAARPQLDLYLEGGIAEALHGAVIAPALAQGYARLWLLGISLGGMGALLTASLGIAELEGVILLAPYLGTPGTIAEIAASGGLASWSAGAGVTALERRMLGWVQHYLARGGGRPAVYLGYGEADRFARGHRLLGDALPAANVMTEPGGHDWETWTKLWQRVLNAAPFDRR